MIKIIQILLIVSFSLQSQAEIYKWVDEHGNISYSDEKPENQATQEVTIKQQSSFKPHDNTNTEKVTKFEPFFTKSEPYQSNKPGSTKKLIMYSASWCGYCKKARNYFNKNRIRFTEYDIEKNSTAKRKYDKLGGKGVPLLVSGTNKMSGFNVAAFEKFYNN